MARYVKDGEIAGGDAWRKKKTAFMHVYIAGSIAADDVAKYEYIDVNLFVFVR